MLRTALAAALTAALAAVSFTASATPVSVSITGATDGGLPMSGVVTYDDSLAGPCRFFSCIANGPGLVDLTIGGTRYLYADATNQSYAQIAEDRSYVRLGVFGGASVGQIAELTLRTPGGFSGISTWPGTWVLNAGPVQFAGSLTAVTAIPLRLPSAVPEPASLLLMATAMAIGAALQLTRD